MAKMDPTSTLNVTDQPGISRERQLADVALDPLAGAAALTEQFTKNLFGKTDLTETYVSLVERAKDVRNNKLGSADNMLTAQAAALNAIFVELARRAGCNMGEYIEATERYMRLALKAQGQCRATLETLAALKNPPVVIAKQANIAAGPQQVNNAPAISPRAEKNQDRPNELLETDYGKRLDGGTKGAAIGSDKALETVGTIDRPAHV